jgi:phospholipid/cholesterol/gamma-HCH transport system substrate-binding protein
METQSTSFKIRLGLFIAAGLLFFLIAIFLIGRQKNLFDPVFKLTTTFYNISGLHVGNNVRFSGIDVGTVERIIQINDTAVSVDMIVKKSVQPFIKNDSKAAIGSEGIIGDRVLIITQGTSEAGSVKDRIRFNFFFNFRFFAGICFFQTFCIIIIWFII